MTTVGDRLYQLGGVPVGSQFTTGNVFFVDSATGSNSNDGKSVSAPVATLDYAIGLCTANKGDIIYLMPGHAETTTAIALDVAGLTIIGLGVGASRPTLTATTAATDLINISVASTWMENIILVGAASGCTALVDIAGADNTFVNMIFRHGAAPTTAVTIASGVRNKFWNCRWLGTANGPAASVAFESATEQASKDYEFIGCIFNYGLYGLDTAAIYDSAAATEEGGIILNCIFSGMDLTAIDFNSSSSANIRGLISGCRATSTGAITIASIYDNSSYALIDCKATDAVAAASPVAIPAATAT